MQEINNSLEVAFVGIKRDYSKLDPDYIDFFNQYHLEIPFYYAKHSNCVVTIVTTSYSSPFRKFDFGGSIRCITEAQYLEEKRNYDVVVHWRKWFEEFHASSAVNVINCCDYNFSSQWLSDVRTATAAKKLYGILCFPTWHEQQLRHEIGSSVRLITGLHLGVDTDIYCPHPDKDPYQMLWASDPGRGLNSALSLAARLASIDKRFVLNICYPDYVPKPFIPDVPFVVDHGNIGNGQKLWHLFNTCGILPYTSTFHEPSSRAHRQAQAAGSLVLYPPAMGSPSSLIEDGVTGYVRPLEEWTGLILRAVSNGSWATFGKHARDFAVSENWSVQAARFHEFFKREVLS